jgi:hypothetical protein
VAAPPDHAHCSAHEVSEKEGCRVEAGRRIVYEKRWGGSVSSTVESVIKRLPYSLYPIKKNPWEDMWV